MNPQLQLQANYPHVSAEKAPSPEIPAIETHQQPLQQQQFPSGDPHNLPLKKRHRAAQLAQGADAASEHAEKTKQQEIPESTGCTDAASEFYDSDEEPLPNFPVDRTGKRLHFVASKIHGIAPPHKPRVGPEYQADIPAFQPRQQPPGAIGIPLVEEESEEGEEDA